MPTQGTAMNKSDLTKTLSKELDLPLRKAEEIVDMLFETMSNALIEGDRIEIRGLGSFTVKEYKGYTGRNPKTGEAVAVNPKKLPFFKAGKELAEGLKRR
jgi:integration host factor subunit beta